MSKAATPAPTSSRAASSASSGTSAPFSQLLSGVTLVISGIQNPERAELRAQALAMGAAYRGDWGPGATHLLCAVKGTPKYNQVKGRGIIVTKAWVRDAHRDRKRRPWRRYALDKAEKAAPESEDEILAEPEATSTRSNRDRAAKAGHRKRTAENTSDTESDENESGSNEEEEDELDSTLPYSDEEDDSSKSGPSSGGDSGGDTDGDVDKTADQEMKLRTSASPKKVRRAASSSSENSPQPKRKDGLPALPDFFDGCAFHLHGQLDQRRQLLRFIHAFGGSVEPSLGSAVTHIIADSGSETALRASAAPTVIVASAGWVLECGRLCQWTDPAAFALPK